MKDPHYGEVLFHFYQQKYFSAITYLLSAQVQQRVPRHVDEAELLLGGLYLSYGLHRQAGRIFHRLIDQHAAPHVRDRAWFYLAKIWYQRGYFAEAESALARVQRALPRELEEERQVLTGLVLIKRQRYREAADVLGRFRSRTEWAQYARYNMGVALMAAGERDDGVRLLAQVGGMRARSSEMHALKDKANLVLGYEFLRTQGAERAHHYLQEVRLQGPLSNKALLGIGWASAARGHYRRALVPWTELHKRNPIDASVQESLLAVPYALRKLQADQQSLRQYQGAISIYEDEIERLRQTIDAIRAGQLLIPELLGDPGSEAGWFWRIEQLSDTPTNRYLLHLLASHRFQEALKDYRDLLFLARNLRRWSSNMDAFDAMLETRKQAYEERLPRIMQSYRALDLTALVHARDRHARALARIERTADAMALASSKEQDWLARLHRAKETTDELAATQDVSEYRRKHKLFSGLLRWQISTDY
ncbi:MAG: tetratricopeptide repeat protein, partial [Acidiferrobacterales bacterium]